MRILDWGKFYWGLPCKRCPEALPPLQVKLHCICKMIFIVNNAIRTLVSLWHNVFGFSKTVFNRKNWGTCWSEALRVRQIYYRNCMRRC